MTWLTDIPTDADIKPFEAKWELNGLRKTNNNGFSNFFPNDFTVKNVLDTIGEAYEKTCPRYGYWIDSAINPITRGEIKIQGQVENHYITTAFPVV